MKHNYRYAIKIYMGAGNHSEISYCFPNPIISRALAIQEFKKISLVAKAQLNNLAPGNPYGITEWDSAEFIRQGSALSSILRPFSLELLLDLDGAEYTLSGQGIRETIEALSAEYHQFKLDGFISYEDETEILENIEYGSSIAEDKPAYIWCEYLTDVPDFQYIQHSILKQESDYLLSVN